MVLGKQLNIYLLIASLVFFALWTSKSSTSGGGGQAAPVLTNVSANFIGSNGTVNLPVITNTSDFVPSTDCGSSSNPAQIVLTFEGPENCRFFLYYVNSEYVQNSNVSYINNFLQTAIQSTGKYEYTITLDVVALPPAVIIDYTIAYAISIASGGGRTGQPLTLSSPTTLQIAFYFQSV